jgi:hypothetical protein
MTVMRWADAKDTIIEYTEGGWGRHSCRRVWLVVRVVLDEDVDFYGSLVFACPPGQADWLDLEDPVLAFDNVREASMVAEHKGEPWRVLNLYDLMAWEDSWSKPRKPRYKASEKVLTEMADAWREKRRREREKEKRNK